MINKNILILSALCSCCSLWADEVVVRHYNYAGPYEVKKPFLADSLDVNSKRFSDKELLNTTVPFCNLSQSGQTLDAASSGELTLPPSIAFKQTRQRADLTNLGLFLRATFGFLLPE